MAISLTTDPRGLIIRTPYNARFVDGLKRIVPNRTERTFTGKTGNPPNAWIVEHQHAAAIRRLIWQCYGTVVELPVLTAPTGKLHHATVRLEYLGACKQRDDRSVTAMGNDGTGWNIVIAESVLKRFFGEPGAAPTPTAQAVKPTLYAVLLAQPTATPDELKTAYRRLARQWHPDVCTEPDAKERFITIDHAYKLLADSTKRKRYDAGLAMEATMRPAVRPKRWDDDYSPFAPIVISPFGYRSPLRCGLLTIDGELKAGRTIISTIHRWDDIIDGDKVMVTSWDMDANNYVTRWV